MRGDLGGAWSYDAYYQYGRTNFAETYPNDFSVTRLQQRARRRRRSRAASPTCRSVLTGTDPPASPTTSSRHGHGHPGGAQLSADPGLPARRQRRVGRQRLGHRQARRIWRAIPLGRGRRRHRARRRISQGVARSPDRRGLLAAAVERPRRPGRADPADHRRVRRPRGVRRGPHADRRERLLPQPLARGRLPPLEIRDQGNAATASRPTPTSSAAISRRSATSASAPATTARSARRTSRSCSRRRTSQLDGNTDPAPATRSPPAPPTPAASAPGPASSARSSSGNPAGQYNGLVGGSPNLTPEVADTYHRRRRAPAALHPAARADGRLVRHQGQERDPADRRRTPSSTPASTTLRPGLLRPHPPRRVRLAVAVRRTASSVDHRATSAASRPAASTSAPATR